MFIGQHDLQGIQQTAVLGSSLKAQRLGHPEHRRSPTAECLPDQRQMIAAAPHTDGLTVHRQLIQAAVRGKQISNALPGTRVIQVFCEDLQHLLQRSDEFFAQFALSRLDHLQFLSCGLVDGSDAANEHFCHIVASPHAHLSDQCQDQCVALGGQ